MTLTKTLLDLDDNPLLVTAVLPNAGGRARASAKIKACFADIFCFASAQKHLYLYINISAYGQLTVSKSALGKAAKR
jgi:hypothetical protein